MLCYYFFNHIYNHFQIIIKQEPFFKNIHHLVSDLFLMSDLKFLLPRKYSFDPIMVNPDLLNLEMIPLAPGLSSSVMFCLSKKNPWHIYDLRKEFTTYSDEGFNHDILNEAEFNKQLINFINDRPDLVMLVASDPSGLFL